jgi:hypothetical protein
MAINTHFYNGILRRYVIAFGNIFDGIYITREDASANLVQTLQVPLSYAPKDKVLARLDQSRETDKNRPAINLPRMSFEMLGLVYAPDRKFNSLNQTTGYSTDLNKLKSVYSPIPYDLNFELYIYVKNAEDGLQIVEQILPFFKPDLTLSVNVLPAVGIKHDTAFVLNSITSSDTYEGDFMNRRAIVWTLSFTVKVYMYGPVSSGTDIIKQALVGYHNTIDTSLFKVIRQTTDQPALLANGSPTSNSSLSVSLSSIAANSNYGISTVIEDL